MPGGLHLVLAAVLFASLPIRVEINYGPAFGFAAAWARGDDSSGSDDLSGSDHDGGSDDGSDDGDDHDNSGSGSSTSGSGGSGSDSSGSSIGSGSSRTSNGAQSPRGGAAPVARIVIRGNDISVAYVDGWIESVQNGRYIMTDPRNRTVIDRAARRTDRTRLFGYLP